MLFLLRPCLSLSHCRVFFIQFRLRRGPAVISGETKTAADKMDVVSPSLAKSNCFPYAWDKVSINAFFPPWNKREVNLGVELLHSAQPNRRALQLHCDVGMCGLILVGLSCPRAET